MDFQELLKEAINKCSQENASNTPDFILAIYLNNCLDAFNMAIQQRETWYGNDPRPTEVKLKQCSLPDGNPQVTFTLSDGKEGK